MELGSRLKEIRKDNNLSQVAFAESLKKTRAAYARYETGDVIPNDTFLHLLCIKYDVNEEWLYHGSGDKYLTNESDKKILSMLRNASKNDRGRVIDAFLTVGTLSKKRFNLILETIEEMGKRPS